MYIDFLPHLQSSLDMAWPLPTLVQHAQTTGMSCTDGPGHSSGLHHCCDAARSGGNGSEGPKHPPQMNRPESHSESLPESRHDEAEEPCVQPEVNTRERRSVQDILHHILNK